MWFPPKLIDQYEKTGCLSPFLLVNAIFLKESLERDDDVSYSSKDKQIYDAVWSDFKQVEELLKNVKGQPRETCVPYKQEQFSPDGYRFIRDDLPGNLSPFKGKQRIFISKDNFYWIIGIEHDGNNNLLEQAIKNNATDVGEIEKNINITGYFHSKTNGSLADMQKALASTVQYFPKIHFPKFHLRNVLENYESLSQLFRPFLSKEDTDNFCPHIVTSQSSSDVGLYASQFTVNFLEQIASKFKKIYPPLHITIGFNYDYKMYGIILERDDLATFLNAAYQPQKEAKTAQGLGIEANSLKWLAAKSIWKKLPQKRIEEFQKEMPDLEPVLKKAQ